MTATGLLGIGATTARVATFSDPRHRTAEPVARGDQDRTDDDGQSVRDEHGRSRRRGLAVAVARGG